MAVTPEREIFSLDLWDGRCAESVLVKQAFLMDDTWRCISLWPGVGARPTNLYRQRWDVATGNTEGRMRHNHVAAITPRKSGR